MIPIALQQIIWRLTGAVFAKILSLVTENNICKLVRPQRATCLWCFVANVEDFFCQMRVLCFVFFVNSDARTPGDLLVGFPFSGFRFPFSGFRFPFSGFRFPVSLLLLLL